MPEGGFDQHFFSFLSRLCLEYIILEMWQESGLFTSLFTIFLSVPGFSWKCFFYFLYMAENMFSFYFGKHRSHLSVEINIV